MDTESRASNDATVDDQDANARPYAAPSTFVPRALDTVRLGIVGLGYVGLPLAVEFGKKYATLGLSLIHI